jgi:hypothetical protein
VARWSLLAAVALLGCPAEPPPPAQTRFNLRVPLPEGWRAQGGAAGALLVGPAGVPVLQLESLARELPSLAQLTAPLAREKVDLISKESTDDFRAVRYHLGDGEAFLGVHRLGGRTVWCASLKGAGPEEVAQAWQVCRGLGADAGAE